MKNILITLITILFISISISGVSFMNYSMTNGNDCIASIMTGTPCPENNIQFFIHHVSSIQSFFTIAITPIFTSVFLSFLLFCFYILFFKKDLRYSIPLVSFNRYKEKLLAFGDNSLLSWLSLFEHSPSIVK